MPDTRKGGRDQGAQTKRWASCDAHGNLRFNWRIIQAPMRLVDYVVAHELAHLRHEDHAKAYWALLGKIMPDYELRRRILGALGARMVWKLLPAAPR
jgi:hypothetical protein